MIGHSITCANIPESRPKTLKKVDATLRTKARTQVFPWKALGAGAPGCDECEVPSIVLVFHNEASTKSGRQDDASASRLSRFLLYSFLKTVWPVSKAPLITYTMRIHKTVRFAPKQLVHVLTNLVADHKSSDVFVDKILFKILRSS
mmetsp:Transcript_35096/g.85015  ORF Transcript_35096/g.85015 Transcript_35096/m.85015 type:complete len:146 (+) Transcript_35096:2682-3119(+)